METKICSKCGKEKDIEEFGKWFDKRRNKYYYHTICKECKNKKQKQWYKDNPEYQKQYRQTHKEYNKQYSQDNKEHLKDYHKQYYQNNKECRKEHYKEYNKQWREDNPDKRRASKRKRRALKAGAEGSHSIQDLKYIYDHQKGICGKCKRFILFEDMTVDHIVPLTWGGSNYPSNIQLLCFSCNASKGNRNDTDYREYIPLFLD